MVQVANKMSSELDKATTFSYRKFMPSFLVMTPTVAAPYAQSPASHQLAPSRLSIFSALTFLEETTTISFF